MHMQRTNIVNVGYSSLRSLVEIHAQQHYVQILKG